MPTVRTDSILFEIKEYLDERFRLQNELLNTRFNALDERLKKINGSVGKHEDCIFSLLAGQAERKAQITNIDDRIDKLEKKSDNWNTINSVGSIIIAMGAALGIVSK